MAINAEVQKNENESPINLIRRFSRRVQGAGIIQMLRNRRYYERQKSRAVRRKHTLKVLRRRQEIAELIKLGKIVEKPKRRGRR